MFKNDLDPSVLPQRSTGSVALFGGSFNPPHLAHAMVALSILAVTEVDELWVLPCADHPFGKGLAPFDARLALCRHAFEGLKSVHIVSVEAALPQPNFTVQTLRAIKAARPQLDLSWVIGSDIVGELHLWKEPKELERLAHMLLIPRDGYPREGLLEMPIPAISSTEIRTRLARGDEVKGLLHRKVLAAIKAQRLYAAEVG